MSDTTPEKMPRQVKRKAEPRTGIIEKVTTPLGFFTLGMLIIEVILGAAAAKATDQNLSIIIIGLVSGFFMLCGMVFYLAVRPAKVDTSPLSTVLSWELSANDILTISKTYSNGLIPPDLILTNFSQTYEQRGQKLKKLGLVYEKRVPSLKGYYLSEEGRRLQRLIFLFENALSTRD